MITKEKKEVLVRNIKQNIEQAEAVFVTNMVGLGANDVNLIRKKVRDAGGKVIICRNTLFARGAVGHVLSSQVEHLKGPNALAFAFKDAPALAKVLYDAGKEFELIQFKGGVFEGKVITSKDIESLAKLPSRDQMLGTLLATFNAPISAFARVLNAIKEKKESEIAS